MIKNIIQKVYPLSPLQEGLLFQNIYDSEADIYFIQIIYKIEGYVDNEILKESWRLVAKKQDILRTGFIWKKTKQLLQYVVEEVILPFIEHDWSYEIDIDGKLEIFLQEDRNNKFDLSNAPAFRVHLIKYDYEKYYLVWSYHHTILDGWSSSIIINEVQNAYRNICKGEEFKLEASRPYSDYIGWLKKQDITKAKAFWKRYLSGVENEVGKLSLASSAEQSEKEYENYIFKLNSIEKEEVKRLARENNLTMNTVFQGALGILLRSYIGKEDLLFGITISGRPVNLEGVEDIVGLFINTVPLRIRARRGDRILSYLGELQQATQLINENGYLSLADIQKIPMHQIGRLFDVAFEFSNFLVNEVGNDNISGNLKIKLLKGIVKAEYPLSVVVLPGEEIEIRLNYQSKYLSKQIIARFEDHFREVLRCMAENPEMVIGNISILSTFEQRKILTEWNNTKVDYRAARSIQELFEKQVDKTPNAKALACGTISMSYNELNNRANQLAHYLKRYGVGPEVLVGIGMERSQEMIIAILGILKAGGGYVPLDMSYPEERLRYMLEDSKVAILYQDYQKTKDFHICQ